MAYPWFSIIAITLVVVLAATAVMASIRVWRVQSLSLPSRTALIAFIAIATTAAITWIVFVAPVYVD